tara:strand:- start:207 stop:392 length:186 start_codon:yes stop_codon:yes gene_type:complete
MSYEAGSLECRLLIEGKEHILNAIKSLSNIEDMDNVQSQLLSIYNLLESMHDDRKEKELKT